MLAAALAAIMADGGPAQPPRARASEPVRQSGGAFGREFTGPRAAIGLSESVVDNVLNDLEQKLVDWAPISLGPIHCRPDLVLHLRC